MSYLYNYAGQPWKTQFWVGETMDRMYLPTPDGYCGDEDNGQTSAWYVFSAMGFYPVCPRTDQYVIGTSLFKKMTIRLENGNSVEINAPDNSSENKYISSIVLHGAPYTKNWISHEALMEGAKINFEMSPLPDKLRGVNPNDFPYSFSRSQK